ncbi:dephospho-CoA kinase [Ideonella sp.]|uniref:dephospho-CoA kinase n=1 Tax=Ideonella sp. TaxID=1929293 RepID=UPI002B484983|nr:dephospho-CoA kinase [Ideonella sp.]HJV69034.1 dephospho-CoA kinase [Ideonella sp.]
MNPRPVPPLRVGLTGGIGSGKSTVAAALARRGACIVDTDAIARELTAPGGAALPAIAAEFGAQMLDAAGALDRARMRAEVFGQTEARHRLEAILHPLIGQQAQARAAAAGAAQPVVFDVPLLTESGHWRERVDRVLVVDCDEALQVRRVMQRSGWAEPEVRRVIAQQAPRSARRSIADAVISNGEGVGLTALDAMVGALWRHWWPQAL